MEKNRVKLVVGGAEYTVLADDDTKYVQELGKEVDSALDSIIKENKRISTTQAAILLALDYADMYKKSTAGADNLRAQIKDYLDDAATAKGKADMARHETEKCRKELDDAKEEIKRLNTQIASLIEQLNAGHPGNPGTAKKKNDR
ncbi:MAG: cell division protein ZapA [Clostridia bacterium]|nr:cell division protein ZapA [Clostridia bacterium]